MPKRLGRNRRQKNRSDKYLIVVAVVSRLLSQSHAIQFQLSIIRRFGQILPPLQTCSAVPYSGIAAQSLLYAPQIRLESKYSHFYAHWAANES